jgi:hypothetical protein
MAFTSLRTIAKKEDCYGTCIRYQRTSSKAPSFSADSSDFSECREYSEFKIVYRI